MVFVENKYTNWYLNLINKAHNRKLSSFVYTEKHHIIPRCLGGTNSPENLIKLAAREHYIAHLLLPKMVEGNAIYKLQLALWRMCSFKSGRYVPNNNAYQIAKENMAKALSILNKGKSLPLGVCTKGGRSSLGRKLSKSHKNKISMYRKKRKLDITTENKINTKISQSLVSYHKSRAEKGENLCPKYKWELLNSITNETDQTTNLKKWCKNKGFNSSLIYREISVWKIISKYRMKDNFKLL